MNATKIRIVPFEEQYTKEFTQLNFEWLEKYFYIEEYDREVLTKPQEYILNPGGFIFMALYGDQVVGTVALIKRGDGDYELSKMAVTEQYKGLRIGQKLMYYCINFAGEMGFERVFLDSNRSLTPAIQLYHKVGFKEIPVPEDSPYERCNIRMELWI
ncbi:MAG: GNAT family N-acetyltransferase [Bacteroidetes bacterium]|nr:MAG: GNAT family N-acetyltransferase [Bacteroidota bacterium]